MSGSKYIWIFSGISLLVLRPALPGYLVENVALSGRAVQSSEYDDGGIGAARNAINGNRNPLLAAGSCILTREQSNPWWRVELDKVYNIHAVMIANSKEHANRLDGAELWLGATMKNNGLYGFRCAVITNIPSGQTFYFSCGIVEARYISVFLPGSEKTLSFCEVEVYHVSRVIPLSNVALRGDATQSSTLAFAAAARAIDARRNSDYGQGSCSHTAENEPNPWWRVDLQKTRHILSVKITNRGDCCPERLDGAEIRIGNSLDNNGNNNRRCALVAHIAAGKAETFYCEGGSVEGRFVNVIIPGERKTLTLCEVEVYLAPRAMKPQANLALKGRATQQSSYGSYGALKAIDGCVNPNLTSGCCTHTATTHEPWWKLDLGAKYRVAAISIINRKDCCAERLIGARIHIGDKGNKSDSRCTHIRNTREAYTLLCAAQGGRYIFIWAPGKTALQLCEVEVYAAPSATKLPAPPASPPPPTPLPPPPPPPPPTVSVLLSRGNSATAVGLRLCWADALFYCRSHYRDLLSVRSPEEQSAVEKLLSRGPFPLTSHIWLGLRRYIMGDKWFWMSGEPMNFTQWTQNVAPLQSANPCGGIARDECSLWRDQPCEQLFNFICQTGDEAGAGQVYYYSSYRAKGSL